jgi:hypothetical protein
MEVSGQPYNAAALSRVKEPPVCIDWVDTATGLEVLKIR